LKAADRLAELRALVNVRNDQIEAGLHHADRARRQDRALVVETGHQNVDAVALDPEHVLGRHFAVREYELEIERAHV
jgi:hypothetical protein